MGKTITVPDNVYARLARQAAARGLSVAALVARLERDLDEARIDTAEERMRTRGLLLPHRHGGPDTGPEFEPVRIEGKPLSETIIEERR